MAEITVLIVDDQGLMREGLATLLSLAPDLRVVGQAGDGIEAIALARQLRPDVILMDVQMPRMDGVTATQTIRAELTQTQVIILTTFDDDEYVRNGLRAGACGYMLKNTPSEHLAEAIHAAARGESPISPSIARKLVAEYARQSTPANRPAMVEPHPSSPDALSEREMEILRALASGMSNREIADKLFITEGTVKNHVSNILAKMSVRDRTQAVLKAKENGWV
jgi:DNA-binding NarL/FixJ family response regulator